jgi:nucleoside-diphosphate-sugar epimerase
MNLAAQVGVGPSVRDPFLYLSTNVKGTLNLLELAREYRVRKFFLSSSSSVYTGQKTPFSEDSPANTPYSSYAATKEAAEALCYSYHYLYGIDMVIARFFTVYGPGGRPDMAPLRFVKRIYEGTPLPIYGDGRQTRDFTYVDDIANGSIKALSLRGHHILNFGNNRPVSLMEFIRLIEKYTGKAAILKMQPSKKIDARNTWANITKAKTLLRWHPRTSLEEGVRKTVAWYLENRAWLNKIL